VPWTSIRDRQEDFIEDQYLPFGFKIQHDPSKMNKSQIKTLLEYWYKRQMNVKVKVPFRFKAYKDRSTGEVREAVGGDGNPSEKTKRKGKGQRKAAKKSKIVCREDSDTDDESPQEDGDIRKPLKKKGKGKETKNRSPEHSRTKGTAKGKQRMVDEEPASSEESRSELGSESDSSSSVSPSESDTDTDTESRSKRAETSKQGAAKKRHTRKAILKKPVDIPTKVSRQAPVQRDDNSQIVQTETNGETRDTAEGSHKQPNKGMVQIETHPSNGSKAEEARAARMNLARSKAQAAALVYSQKDSVGMDDVAAVATKPKANHPNLQDKGGVATEQVNRDIVPKHHSSPEPPAISSRKTQSQTQQKQAKVNAGALIPAKRDLPDDEPDPKAVDFSPKRLRTRHDGPSETPSGPIMKRKPGRPPKAKKN